MPYSGPASAYASTGAAEAAYFRMINDKGGINGRKITFISYDDAYSPPKTMEQTRRLVESDEVLLIFQALGTPTNTAVQKYLNQKKVPQLFVGSGASKWGDPAHFPWTMGLAPTYWSEGRVFAKHILERYPNGRIAILWQNDDAGKEQLQSVKTGLGERADMIVASESYEIVEPTVDSHITSLKASSADIMISMSTPKAAAQAIKKVAELGWKPTYFQSSTSASISAVLRPAGFDNAKGVISAAFMKGYSDPTWKDDPEMLRWIAFMDKYYPEGSKENGNNVAAHIAAQVLVEVLRQCGDDLTRENIMKQAANLHGYRAEMLLPGITINTGPADYYPIEQLQLIRFDGERYQPVGSIVDVSAERRE
ncbi:ABC-type branched-chain amino acid transport system, substrate-binding protein [Bradyrhizobium sp. Gha]|nr:ABC-type branched-chain amino acid transport system, substrate-binding protein [Bradyrhizobium sp. Gha]